jgi:hypothetical protein
LSPSFFGQAATFVVDRFLHRPLGGLVEIGAALAQMVPRLARAAVAAFVSAIVCQLSNSERQQVQQEMRHLLRGLELLAWPAALIGLLVIWQVPGGFWLLVLTALVVVLTLEREMRAAHS